MLPCTKPPLPRNPSSASRDHLRLETHRNTEQAYQGTQPYRNHTAASKRHALKTTYSSGLYTTPPESQLLPQTKIQIYERARTHVLMTDSATPLPHSLIRNPRDTSDLSAHLACPYARSPAYHYHSALVKHGSTSRRFAHRPSHSWHGPAAESTHLWSPFDSTLPPIDHPRPCAILTFRGGAC
jgi:hypothetical protein